jgi:hypothetical protein
MQFPKIVLQNGCDDDERPMRSKLNKLIGTPTSSTSIWTWGANNNYLLGVGNCDERTYPEQLDLSSCVTLTYNNGVLFEDLASLDPEIKQIGMSKYHVAIIAGNELYTYGY